VTGLNESQVILLTAKCVVDMESALLSAMEYARVIVDVEPAAVSRD